MHFQFNKFSFIKLKITMKITTLNFLFRFLLYLCISDYRFSVKSKRKYIKIIISYNHCNSHRIKQRTHYSGLGTPFCWSGLLELLLDWIFTNKFLLFAQQLNSDIQQTEIVHSFRWIPYFCCHMDGWRREACYQHFITCQTYLN